MKNRRFPYLLALILSGLSYPYSVQAQIIYTRHFTKQLEKCQATFIQPVEGFYKIKMPRKSEINKVDLALDSDEKSFELRYILEPGFETVAPHIIAMTMASTLATNDQHFDIEMNVFPKEQTAEYFYADWASYIDFIPKRNITTKHYGRLVTVFRDGSGLMHTVMYFDVHDREKDFRLYSLTFKAPPTPLGGL